MNLGNYLIFPTEDYPAFSAFHILQFLQKRIKRVEENPLIFLSFSAGAVGAMGAARIWQQEGGRVQAFIALDGWGVPLLGNFPFYRLSHDRFTHWSSALLGRGEESFYADPEVEHLTLWQMPHRVTGWRVQYCDGGREVRSQTTAAAFLATLIDKKLR